MSLWTILAAPCASARMVFTYSIIRDEIYSRLTPLSRMSGNVRRNELRHLQRLQEHCYVCELPICNPAVSLKAWFMWNPWSIGRAVCHARPTLGCISICKRTCFFFPMSFLSIYFLLIDIVSCRRCSDSDLCPMRSQHHRRAGCRTVVRA